MAWIWTILKGEKWLWMFLANYPNMQMYKLIWTLLNIHNLSSILWRAGTNTQSLLEGTHDGACKKRATNGKWTGHKTKSQQLHCSKSLIKMLTSHLSCKIISTHVYDSSFANIINLFMLLLFYLDCIGSLL